MRRPIVLLSVAALSIAGLWAFLRPSLPADAQPASSWAFSPARDDFRPDALFDLCSL